MSTIHLVKKNISIVTIILVSVFTIVLNFNHKKWEDNKAVIQWDVKSYYAYLPATFIYNDLSLDFIEQDEEKFEKLIWPIETPLKKKAIVTTMGLSLLYSPFFALAHAFALSSDHLSDGYSLPYRFALTFSSLFYLIIGLFFLRKVLKEFFSEKITAVVISTIALGTNLLYYFSYEAAMPHSYNFTLISIFLFCTIKFYKKPNLNKIFLIGLLSGLITLIRPTNIIVLFLFFLWNVSSFKDLKNRTIWFLNSSKLILVMILAFTIIWVPQFIYWYWVSGEIFYFTYGESGGKFFFLNPQIKNILISYKKGWFIYTPIMFIAFVGIFTLIKTKKGLFFPVFLFTILNIYILSSWWCWWFGGSFGLRAFIDSYAIMAIPLASFICWFNSSLLKELFSYSLIFLLIIFNNFQIQQYNNSAIHYWWMNKEAYWETFLKLHPTDRYWKVITKPDYRKAKNGIYVEIPLTD